MVGPVPGIKAQRLPMTVPRIIGQNASFRSAFDGNMSEMPTLAYFMSTVSVLLMLFMNSAMPNMPSASAMISTPSYNSVMPKVKRASPVSMSVPTMPINRPSTVIAMPLSGEPLASVEPASRPTSISEQTSAGPNLSATETRNGARKIISVMPNDAPTKAAMMVMPSAVPPLPCWVIGKPSRQVTACGGWHGRFNRIEQIAQPYWAP